MKICSWFLTAICCKCVWGGFFYVPWVGELHCTLFMIYALCCLLELQASDVLHAVGGAALWVSQGRHHLIAFLSFPRFSAYLSHQIERVLFFIAPPEFLLLSTTALAPVLIAERLSAVALTVHLLPMLSLSIYFYLLTIS